MIRLLGWLRIVEPVWLRAHDGEMFLTIRRRGPWGYWAHVYPLVCVGHVNLHPDGTCTGKSIYIEEWRPWRKETA